MMLVMDLFINHRRVNLMEIIFILITSASITMGFIGEKIFSNEDINLNPMSVNKRNKKINKELLNHKIILAIIR